MRNGAIFEWMVQDDDDHESDFVRYVTFRSEQTID